MRRILEKLGILPPNSIRCATDSTEQNTSDGCGTGSSCYQHPVRAEVECSRGDFIDRCQDFSLRAFPASASCSKLINLSSLRSGETYIVDPIEQTCTCPDFKSRQEYPKNYFGRWCKHILRVLNDAEAFRASDFWHRAIASSGFGGPYVAAFIHMNPNPPVMITFGKNTEWVNIFAKTKRTGETIKNPTGHARCFGWSVAERRWSYGDAPPGARELRKFLCDLESFELLDNH